MIIIKKYARKREREKRKYTDKNGHFYEQKQQSIKYIQRKMWIPHLFFSLSLFLVLSRSFSFFLLPSSSSFQLYFFVSSFIHFSYVKHKRKEFSLSLSISVSINACMHFIITCTDVLCFFFIIHFFLYLRLITVVFVLLIDVVLERSKIENKTTHIDISSPA